MKMVITKVMVVVMAFSLASCATNTRQENTVAGAGTGAVAGGLLGALVNGASHGAAIGVGAVVGAVIGGLIGHSMESTDRTNTYKTMNSNPTDSSMVWSNHKSDVHYKITPTSSWMTINGNPFCRTYVAKAIIQGTKRVVNGTACRQPDGTWVDVTN